VTVGEIYEILDDLSPFELQEKWDNSGLLLGEVHQRVERVVVSVDIDGRMVQEADEGTLFILHHPLIFSGMKRLLWSEYPANILREMVKKEHALIAMHTNFDKTHLKLGLERLKVVGERRDIGSVAMTTGSGASLMDGVDADLFLTGDIKFHDAMKAHSMGGYNCTIDKPLYLHLSKEIHEQASCRSDRVVQDRSDHRRV